MEAGLLPFGCPVIDDGVVNYPCDNGRFDHAGERKVPNILYIH